MWTNAGRGRTGCVIGWTVAVLVACGGDDDGPDVDDVIPDAGPDAMIPDLDPSFVPTGDAGVLDANPDFPGITTSTIPFGLAPQGCAGGLGTNGHLDLVLGGGVNAVHIAVVGGEVQANGVTCSAADGSLATAEATLAVAVYGHVDDNQLILDLSQDMFGPKLLAASLPITVDLGEGWDAVALVGTYEGDAILTGAVTADTLLRFGASGSQVRISNTEDLVVSTGPGDDTLAANGGDGIGDLTQLAVRLYGGEDRDTLQGGLGGDLLFGGGGDDEFLTAAVSDGSDLYDGGEGIDALIYAERSLPVSVTLGVGADDGEADEADDVMLTIEHLTGGAGDDVIVGSEADNVITGGPGNDTLHGQGGNDRFIEAEVAQGSDSVYGGPGNDAMEYSERTNGVRFTACVPSPEDCETGACGCGNDSGEIEESDTLVGLESATGGSGNDQLIGDDEDNWLYGEAGADEIFGAAGEDTLYGGEGMDTVDGGAGQGDICAVEPSENAVGCELGG
jgi:Ca2+-binding RTX toxin-like protein